MSSVYVRLSSLKGKIKIHAFYIEVLAQQFTSDYQSSSAILVSYNQIIQIYETITQADCHEGYRLVNQHLSH